MQDLTPFAEQTRKPDAVKERIPKPELTANAH